MNGLFVQHGSRSVFSPIPKPNVSTMQPNQLPANQPASKNQDRRLRHIKYALAPFVILPLLLTLTTGSLYQAADLAGQGEQFDWLLSLHKGNFGPLKLELIYPFLNALGLLIMVVAGFLLWYRASARRKQATNRD